MACSNRVAGIVEMAGGRLLGPSPGLIALAAEKQRTAEHLAAAGVPVALGEAVDSDNLLTRAAAIGYPVVFKRDGAGSKDLRLSPTAMLRKVSNDVYQARPLGKFYPGIAASVAALCGPSGMFPLPACRQRLSDDGRFRYLGGSCPRSRRSTDGQRRWQSNNSIAHRTAGIPRRRPDTRRTIRMGKMTWSSKSILG